ncbi:MAG: hypothetical protein ABIV06_09605 [Thermoanaerobaculia bacterium]
MRSFGAARALSLGAAVVLFRGLGELHAQVTLGGEVAVSQPPLGGVADPEVAVTRDGSFLVAWKDGNSGQNLVAARFFDALGQPTTGPHYLESIPEADTNDQTPAIAFDERTERMTVAWTVFDGTRHSLRLRAISSTGQPEGAELVVSGNGSAATPALALSGTARWNVGWSSLNFESNGIDVFAQAFEGDAPVGQPVRMNAEPYGNHVSPQVASDPFGHSVIAWEADPSNLLEPLVRLQRLSRDGEKVGPAFGVPIGGASLQLLCGVGMDSQGRFVVAWSQGDPVPEGSLNVWAQRFSVDGTALANAFQVPTENAGAQYDCDLAMNREGDFAVVWKHYRGTDEDYYDLYLRAYRPDGTPYGDPVRVDEPRDLQIPWAAEHPSLSMNDAGVLVVAWEGGRYDRTEKQIFARKFVLPCSGAATSLCLGQGRFRLHADWWVGEGRTGDGRAFPLRSATGGFWFFSADNPELVVKVLDGCGSNGHHWIYAAGLTDVEAHLSVTDTRTGEIWSRVNPYRQPFAPLQDIEALGGCPAAASTALAPLTAWPSTSWPERTLAGANSISASASCVAGETTLCLAGGRFAVTARFRDWTSTASSAQAEPLTETSGLFWFYSPDNLELFVKSIDACGEFDRFWIFAAGLTNLEVEITVRDHWGDLTEVYRNELGTAFALVRDTANFDTCPLGG